jgi:hypothetical protein
MLISVVIRRLNKAMRTAGPATSRKGGAGGEHLIPSMLQNQRRRKAASAGACACEGYREGAGVLRLEAEFSWPAL